jgi:hypothetical protein
MSVFRNKKPKQRSHRDLNSDLRTMGRRMLGSRLHPTGASGKIYNSLYLIRKGINPISFWTF